ncbi:MAG: T9SS type A sorting domain-containing protein [Cytophagaceae bacterium]|jgi:hypothetical protein|nr:T9SS type A sorting domain-containing protein [Cytophagaceae bacterium]
MTKRTTTFILVALLTANTGIGQTHNAVRSTKSIELIMEKFQKQSRNIFRSNVSKAANTVNVLDSLIDETTIGVSKVKYAYNAFLKPVLEETYEDNGFYTRQMITYDANQYILFTVGYQSYNGGNLMPDDSTAYLYNAQEQLAATVNYIGNGGSAWLPFENVAYTYYSDGNLHTEEYYDWDYDSNDWKSDPRLSIEYSNYTTVHNEIYPQLTTKEEWIDGNLSITKEEQSASDNVLTIITSESYDEGETFEPAMKMEATFDLATMCMVSSNIYIYAEIDWLLYLIMESTNDNNGNISFVQSMLNLEDGSFAEFVRNDFVVNTSVEMSNVINPFLEDGDFSNVPYMPLQITTCANGTINQGCTFYYTLKTVQTGINSVNNSGNGLLVYPNPTSGELTIENGKWKVENVGIYDATGRLVLLPPFGEVVGGVTINISHLPAGVYFVKVGNATTKVVKR